jgi:hypothetical protein
MRTLLWLALAGAFGCGAPSVEDDLTLTVDDAASELGIDTTCESSCADDGNVHAVIKYDNANMTRPAKDTVELDQYRVDYALRGVGNVQYFAAETGPVPIEPGGQQMLSLRIVGQAQRDAVRKAADGKPVSGTAKLQFAGYDFNNKQIFLETTFNVRFEDLVRADENLDAGAAGDAQ